ncbi:MAG: hypothetical protein Q7S96_01385 [bacterium]|nr:hypothetical protein [bacterium]
MWKHFGNITIVLLVIIGVVIVVPRAWRIHAPTDPTTSMVVGLEIPSMNAHSQEEGDAFAGLPDIAGSRYAVPPITYDQMVRDGVGIIEGSLSYPSHFVAFQVVCAEHVETKRRHCTDEQLYDARYRYRVGYQLVVPEGMYTVASFAPQNSGRVAVYARRTHCSREAVRVNDAGCSSGSSRPVMVYSGEMITGIDPDW